MSEPAETVLLLTNDDGVDAPGMHALRQAAEDLGRCRVIAPSGPISGCGHQVTTHQPIEIVPRDDGTLAVKGSPADCVRLAIHEFEPELQWVFSGINAGGNLGTDTYNSGTVAAAREAAIRGLPAIAISHYIARGRLIDWPRAALWAGRVLRMLMSQRPVPGTFWNVNLPHPAPGSPEPEIVICPLDPSPLPLDYRLDGNFALYTGDYQKRARRPGADVAVCFEGQIAVTLISLIDSQRDGRPGQ